jgi:uncharacterized protein (TIGR02246 family)
MKWPRSILILLVGSLLTGLGWTFAQQRGRHPVAASDSADLSPDEQQIRESLVRFVEAYNKADPKAIAELFTPGAELFDSEGPVAHGREAIEETYRLQFEEYPRVGLSLEVLGLRFPAEGVAIEEGLMTFFPDGETAAVRSRYTAMHLKHNGKWLIAVARTLKEAGLSNFVHLQPLAWLVGDWVDEGPQAAVRTSCRWDRNHSFLIQNFTMMKDGEVVQEGTQRIGWDPQSRQIRSWSFDSEGGFGEATWVYVGDAWVIKVRGVTAGGEAATATRTLTPISEDRATLVSTDRIAGDRYQPDQTITMVRGAPPPAAAPQE